MSQNRQKLAIDLEDKSSENFLLCPISNEPVDTVSQCGHLFQKEAIQSWIDRSDRSNDQGHKINSCPTCRKDISAAQLFPVYGIDDIAKHFKQIKTVLDRKNEELAQLKLMPVNAVQVKDLKNQTVAVKKANAYQQTTTAIASILEEQQMLIQERKKLMQTNVPALKAKFKKLALLTKLGADDDGACYRKDHSNIAEQMEKKILPPYLQQLTQLNQKIETNENSLKALRAHQKNNLKQLSTQQRITSLLALKSLGGEGRLKAVPKTSKMEDAKFSEAKSSSIARFKLSAELIGAVIKNNLADAKKIIEQGANVNILDGAGVPLIYYAAKNPEMLKLLVTSGTNIDAVGSRKITILYDAVRDEDVNKVITLLELGADPRVQAPGSGYSALSLAKEFCRNELIKQIILEREAELNNKEQQIMRGANPA